MSMKRRNFFSIFGGLGAAQIVKEAATSTAKLPPETYNPPRNFGYAYSVLPEYTTSAAYTSTAAILAYRAAQNLDKGMRNVIDAV